jgi:tRNA modification GTPase
VAKRGLVSAFLSIYTAFAPGKPEGANSVADPPARGVRGIGTADAMASCMQRPGAETIFAPATAIGRAALAIVRVSGPAAGDVCRRLTGRSPPAPRRATRARLGHPDTAELLDEGLVLWFPGPHSFTGEDVLEVHLHGGRAVVSGIIAALSDLPGLRPAEPGEFTRRAFLNGRLDLTAVEGLADLIDAETRAQARQALHQLDGALGRLYEEWRRVLLGALARLEAEIDFAPEEEVPDDLLASVRPEVERLSAEIATHLADGHRGERLRAGLTVAVIGPPNAGKSSLVNRLARRDVAIVTPVPGTTRDVLEVHLDLAGYPVTLLDTAGLREASDLVEAEGVRRARDRAERADLRLIMFDGAAWPSLDPATAALVDRAAVVTVNKSDLIGERGERGHLAVGGRAALPLSCLTGDGLPGLLEVLTERARELMTTGDEPLLTRARHRSALQAAAEALARFSAAPGGAELALMAEDLRLAARALGRITGEVAVEDVLDRIFAEFCIGK